MFRIKEVLSEQYLKAINIINQNLNERYHVLYGLRLSEILFPDAEYGSDAFFKSFELINSIVTPLVIYDLVNRKPAMVLGFDSFEGVDYLKDAGVDCLVLEGLKDLLVNTNLSAFYD